MKKIIFLLLFSGSFFWCHAYDGDGQSYICALRGSRIKPGAAINIYDGISYMKQEYNWHDSEYVIRVRLSLAQDSMYRHNISTYRVSYKLILTDTNNNKISLSEEAVVYYARDRSYADIHLKEFRGYTRAELWVTKTNFAVMPQDLLLELELCINRCTKSPLSTPVVATARFQANRNELLLAWGTVNGAAGYDLEWLFVDNPRDNGRLPYDFTNATRVNIAENHYAISMAYPKGTLLYRVRAIGKVCGDSLFYSGTDQSPWSFGSDWGTSLPPPSPLYRYDYAGLETEANWQYNAAYAEEGKRKEGITFFDGTLRNRQQVTLNNSDEAAIVGETFYDYIGRPALQSIPAATPSQGIRYYGTAGGNTGHFNGQVPKSSYASDHGLTHPSPFPQEAGSSLYYSAGNPFTGKPYQVNLHAIPTDSGYLYTQTRYLNDGTERIHSVSGTGNGFSLGKGRDSRYHYGKPVQQELDQLFGNEAGDASHYQTVLSIDPNGVKSVSYYDMHERLVATAVAGGGANLLDIDNTPGSRKINSTYHFDNESRNYSLPLVVREDALHSFLYAVNPAEDLCDQCGTVHGCMACVYDFSFSVWNAETKDFAYLWEESFSGSYTKSFDILLPQGSYLISKNLTLREEGISAMLEEYQKRQAPCVPYTRVEPEPCYSNCEKYAMDKLGLKEPDYKDPQFVALVEECENPQSPSDTKCGALRRALLADMSPGGQYFDNIRSCCPLDSNCTTFPTDRNGFMGEVLSSVLDNDPAIRNLMNRFRPPYYSALWDSLRANWEPGMEEILLQYHPEYPLFNILCECGDYTLQNKYDQQVQSTNSYEEAKLLGLFNPLGMEIGYEAFTPSFEKGYQPFEKPEFPDPYFSEKDRHCCPEQLSRIYEELRNSLLQYLEFEAYGQTYYASAWCLLMDPAGIAHFGGGGWIPQSVVEAFASMQNEVLETYALQYRCTVEDARWILFRSIYLYLKEKAIHRYIYDPEYCLRPRNIYKQPFLEGQADYFSDLFPPAYAGGCSRYLYADPACKTMTLTIGDYDSFQIRFLCNPMQDVDVHNFMELYEHNREQLDQSCRADCETFAEEWIRSLQAYFSVSCPQLAADSAYREALKTRLVGLCYDGCYQSMKDETYGDRQLLDIDKQRDLLANFDCDIGKFDPPLIVFPERKNLLQCGCNNFTETLALHDLTLWDDTKIIWETLDKNYGIDMDTEFWAGFCQKGVYDFIFSNNNDTTVWDEYKFPELFRCREGDPGWLSECERLALLTAASRNADAFALAQQEMTEQHGAGYRIHCMQNIRNEELNIRYDLNEYLYTLYYYDQAGNLVKTVPPQGVALVTSTSLLDQAATYRRNRTDYKDTKGFIWPGHTMVTNYRYNTLDQVTQSRLPDHDEDQLLFYDILSRPAISRQPNQTAENAYSYTLYDELGRITETGKLDSTSTVMKPKIAADPIKLRDFIDSARKTEITRTYYDQPLLTALGQKRLRNRIAAITLQENENTPYHTATHYSYDVHGNVQRLIQNLPELKPWQRHLATLDYEYDLVSGNVKKVWYQKGRAEQFIHRYRYDADNRLTHVYTSADHRLWHCEARYFYYPHGPVSRIELGERQVQGMDYAYTVQGWLKAMNGAILYPDYEIGKDASTAINTNTVFAADAFASTLQYFKDDFASPFPATVKFWNNHSQATDLFNGNIAGMSTQYFTQTAGEPVKSMFKAFRYDKINRIKGMRTAYLSDKGIQLWEKLGGAYNTYYEYDFNGNLLYLLRYNEAIAILHEMDYEYYKNTNRLYRMWAYSFNSSTYTYDPSGNLLRDNGEDMNIQWNMPGKIKQVSSGSGVKLQFDYSALGQRQVKQSVDKKWYSIHDATGNVMAVYETFPDMPEMLRVSEQPLYGSRRLGVYKPEIYLNQGKEDPATQWHRTIGKREFEITDHLGNVNAVVSDRKIERSLVNGQLLYSPLVTSFTDCYPFGFPMPERSSTNNDYRYGFNGQEKDNEIYGEGASYTAEFWQYDTRLGRRWNVDPKLHPAISPYATFNNNPIFYNDLFGDTIKNAVSEKVKEAYQIKKEKQALYDNLIAAHQGILTKRNIRNYKENSGLKQAEKDLLILENRERRINLMIKTFRIIMPNEFNYLDNLPLNITINYSPNIGPRGEYNPQSTIIPANLSTVKQYGTNVEATSWAGTFSGDIQITLWGGSKLYPFKTNYLANEFGDIDYFFKNVIPNDPVSFQKWIRTGNGLYPEYWSDPTGAGQKSFDYQKLFERTFNNMKGKYLKVDNINWIIYK